jgi:hypothetical protein
MNPSTIPLTQLVFLHARLSRMQHNNPELLHAIGFDELLPLVNRAVDLLPRLEDIASDICATSQAFGQIGDALRRTDNHALPVLRVRALLDPPSQQLLHQSQRLAALL